MTIKTAVDLMLNEDVTEFRFFHHADRVRKADKVSVEKVMDAIYGMENWPVMGISIALDHSTRLANGSVAYLNPQLCTITFRFPEEPIISFKDTFVTIFNNSKI